MRKLIEIPEIAWKSVVEIPNEVWQQILNLPDNEYFYYIGLLCYRRRMTMPNMAYCMVRDKETVAYREVFFLPKTGKPCWELMHTTNRIDLQEKIWLCRRTGSRHNKTLTKDIQFYGHQEEETK